MNAVDSNPLVNFRKPQQLGGGHFTTQREDVVNEVGMLNIYPGDFKYREDAAIEIELGMWEDNGTTQAVAHYLKMTGQDGYNVAEAKQWEVTKRLELAWKADPAGRLTFGGMAGGRDHPTMVLMWRTGEEADRCRARSLKWSNEVNKTAEEKQAEMQEKLAPLGASVTMTLEDDDGSDDPKPVRKRRG